MLIWSLLGSVIGSDVRVGEPGRFLATIPGVRTLTGTGLQFDDLAQTWPGEEKVFLQQRIVIPRADHLRLPARTCWRRDYLIVGEFDDDPGHFAELVRTDYFALRSCHCIQTTTDVMAETLRAFNPHVVVFPNQIAALPPPPVASRAAELHAGPVTHLLRRPESRGRLGAAHAGAQPRAGRARRSGAGFRSSTTALSSTP